MTGAFLVTMVGYGIACTVAAFAPGFAWEFGASHASFSLVSALAGFISFTVSAISSPLADPIGSRLLASAGMLLVAVGLRLAAAPPIAGLVLRRATGGPASSYWPLRRRWSASPGHRC